MCLLGLVVVIRIQSVEMATHRAATPASVKKQALAALLVVVMGCHAAVLPCQTLVLVLENVSRGPGGCMHTSKVGHGLLQGQH